MVHGEDAVERVTGSTPCEASSPVAPGLDAGSPGCAERGNEVGEGLAHGGHGSGRAPSQKSHVWFVVAVGPVQG